MEFNDPLDVGYIDFRASQIQEYNGTFYAQLLAYKDARVDMEILDLVAGVGKWQNEFRRDSPTMVLKETKILKKQDGFYSDNSVETANQGVLQCGIGVYLNDQWAWKWSNGVPSQFESVKGEYSDAFKRAGFMWGIGRDLYDYPQIRITLNEAEVTAKNGKPTTTYRFTPNKWDWYWTNKAGEKKMAKPNIPGWSLEAYEVTKNGSKVNRFKSNPYFSNSQR